MSRGRTTSQGRYMDQGRPMDHGGGMTGRAGTRLAGTRHADVHRAGVRRVGIRRAAGLVAAAGALAVVSACAGPAGPGTGQRDSVDAAAASNPSLDPGSPLGGVPAPDIRLVNQFGQHMALSQFRGKAVILAFTDSECTNICPLTTGSMLEAKQMLGKAADRVQLLSVDANPKATSVPDVLAYSRVHGMVNQWDFLTGSLSQLRAVWRAYHIAVQIERGEIDHTPALFVIDPQGREQKVYLTQMSFTSVTQSAQVLAHEVASLLPGHPRLDTHGPLSYIGGVSPTAKVTLPGIGSSRVTLGPGRARLVMFFATWLTQTSNLAGRLKALNQYAHAAKDGRLPALTAVDEGTTEPSPGAAAAFINGLGKPLAYPVARDVSGRVGDGYGVQDQPWFVLVSPAGKVLWKHDGWLSVRALKAAAAKA